MRGWLGADRAPAPDTHLHRCVADGDGECNVCSQCCQPWLGAKHDCEACVNATCVNAEQPKAEAAPFDCQAVGTEEHPVECSVACFESCIFSAEVLESPCMRDCALNPQNAGCVGLVLFASEV